MRPGYLHQDLVDLIEAAVNREIPGARDAQLKTLPRQEPFRLPLPRTKLSLLPQGIQQVRTAEIVGLDLQADGRAHVNRTSEVRHIRVAG